VEEKLRKLKEEIKKMKEANVEEMPTTYDLLSRRLIELAEDHKQNANEVRTKNIDIVDKLLDYIEQMEK